MKIFKICALNVNGFRDRASDPKMMAILRNFQTEDIACLLDTRLDPTLEYKIKQLARQGSVRPQRTRFRRRDRHTFQKPSYTRSKCQPGSIPVDIYLFKLQSITMHLFVVLSMRPRYPSVNARLCSNN